MISWFVRTPPTAPPGSMRAKSIERWGSSALKWGLTDRACWVLANGVEPVGRVDASVSRSGPVDQISKFRRLAPRKPGARTARSVHQIVIEHYAGVTDWQRKLALNSQMLRFDVAETRC